MTVLVAWRSALSSRFLTARRVASASPMTCAADTPRSVDPGRASLAESAGLAEHDVVEIDGFESSHVGHRRRRCGRVEEDRRPDVAVRSSLRGRSARCGRIGEVGRAARSISSSLRIRVSGLRSSWDASADEPPLTTDRVVEPIERLVHRVGQPVDLVARAGFGDPPGEVAPADLGHLGPHLLHGPQGSTRQPPREHAEHEQRHAGTAAVEQSRQDRDRLGDVVVIDADDEQRRAAVRTRRARTRIRNSSVRPGTSSHGADSGSRL